MYKYQCHIAVIDDGINDAYYELPPLNYNISLVNSKTKSNDTSKNSSRHGSICAAIIYKYARNVQISSIKILNGKSPKGICIDLIKAIEWCIDYNIDLINLSLGSINKIDSFLIKSSIKKATDAGIIIVAAQSNKANFTYPACLDTVIGVRHSDAYLPGQFSLRWNPFDGVDILTSARHILKKTDGSIHQVSSCNSFATPYITALVYNEIVTSGKMSKNSILKKLESKATYIQKASIKSQIPFIKYPNALPIIHVEGEVQSEMISFTNGLQNIFLNDGVEVCVLANLSVETIHDYEALPKDVDTDRFIAALQYKYNLELLIVCGFIETNSDIDVILEGDLINIFCNDSYNRSFKKQDYDKGIKYISALIYTF